MPRWDDFRGVAPVISVVLLVAIVVILSAVISVFVLGLGEDVSDAGPAVSFDAEERSNTVVFTHRGGDTLSQANLYVEGAATWSSPDDDIAAGDKITVIPDSGAEEVALAWTQEGTSTILIAVEIAANTLVLNPTLSAGSGFNATFWEQETRFGNLNESVERSSNRALIGDYSMRQVDINTGYSREFISDPVDVSAGAKYEFGGSYYLEATSDEPGDYRRAVRITWLDDGGNPIHTDSSFADYQNFDEWTEVRLTEDAPSGAEQARIKIESKKDGADNDVYWDDLFLEKTDTD